MLALFPRKCPLSCPGFLFHFLTLPCFDGKREIDVESLIFVIEMQIIGERGEEESLSWVLLDMETPEI